MKKTKRLLKNISAVSWEHPADRAALAALQKIPGVDKLCKKFVGITTEKSIRLATLASAIRTSDRQFPKLYNLLREACYVLDIEEIPEMFVAEHPFMNAGAIGVEKPFIVLNSSVVDKLSDEEISAVIGHELGHCMSGHLLYKTLLFLLVNLSKYMMNVPLSGIAVVPIILALKEWDRKSELSADRAGLLVTQDPQISYSLLMKMSGGTSFNQMNLNEFFMQAEEYKNLDGLSDNVHKLLNLMTVSHPFPVLRLTELKTWVDSSGYEKIIATDYIERGAKEHSFENLKAAGKKYREDIETTKGPLADIASTVFEKVDDIGDHASGLKDKATDLWDSLFKNDSGKTG